MAYELPIRVYWEDTDAGGIVFYANYLKFFERARTEWLRSLGIGQQALREQTGGMFVVSETAIKYHRPARLDDELMVTARLQESGRASLTIAQQAFLLPQNVSAAGPSQGARAPEGLTAAAPRLPVQGGTDGRATASRGGTTSAARTAASVGAILLCEGSIRIGWVAAASMKPERIPSSVLDVLK